MLISQEAVAILAQFILAQAFLARTPSAASKPNEGCTRVCVMKSPPAFVRGAHRAVRVSLEMVDRTRVVSDVGLQRRAWSTSSSCHVCCCTDFFAGASSPRAVDDSQAKADRAEVLLQWASCLLFVTLRFGSCVQPEVVDLIRLGRLTAHGKCARYYCGEHHLPPAPQPFALCLYHQGRW